MPTKTASPFKAPNLTPPKAPKQQQHGVANYQTRWEREKAKARAEGTDIEGGDTKTIGPWVLGEMLGRGASGRVRLARHCLTGKLAAVKILNLHHTLSSRASALATAGDKAEKMMLTAEREIAVMKLLDHPNIMQMYDVWASSKELYLVLEYVQGGELFDYLCSRGSRLPLMEAVSIIKQVLAGVDYCHRFNICHRDLKPENILLTSDEVSSQGASAKADLQIKRVKIADFGMSTLDSLNGMLRTSCGSPHYASPEIVRGHSYSGAGSDIWSCGVILYALLTSRLPFDDPNVNKVLRKVKDGKFVVPEWVPPQGTDLLNRMLEVDIGKRITMAEIFAHPLLKIDTPGIILPPAPKIEEIALAVVKNEIDSDLLRNLCIIWREKDTSSMVSRLCSDEKNFEKAFYFLLCRYRDRSFEEYNMDLPQLVPSTNVSPSPSPIPTPYGAFEGMNMYSGRSSSPVRRHFPGHASPRIPSSPVSVPANIIPNPVKDSYVNNSPRRHRMTSTGLELRKGLDTTTITNARDSTTRSNSNKANARDHSQLPQPTRYLPSSPPRKLPVTGIANFGVKTPSVSISGTSSHRRASSTSSITLPRPFNHTGLAAARMRPGAAAKSSSIPIPEGKPMGPPPTPSIPLPPPRHSLVDSTVINLPTSSIPPKNTAPKPSAMLPDRPLSLIRRHTVQQSTLGKRIVAGDSAVVSTRRRHQGEVQNYSTDEGNHPSEAIPESKIHDKSEIRGLGLFVSPPTSPTVEKKNNLPTSKERVPHLSLDAAIGGGGLFVEPHLVTTLTDSVPGANKATDRISIQARADEGNNSMIELEARQSTSRQTTSHSGSGSEVQLQSSSDGSGVSNISSDGQGEPWEKIEAVPHTMANGLPCTPKKAKKHKPVPLDLIKSRDQYYQQGSTSPLDYHKSSPILSPFLGFSGFPWSSPAPPTPSLTGASTLSSTASSSASPSTGRGIFSKIFDWKSPPLVLLSTESVPKTREECSQILRELNIAFSPIDGGGFKCRVDEMRDSNGNHLNKTVRFRINFEGRNTSSPDSPSLNMSTANSGPKAKWGFETGFVDPNRRNSQGMDRKTAPFAVPPVVPVTCTVVLVQERGAYSMLKAVHQRMKELWRFDCPEIIIASPDISRLSN